MGNDPALGFSARAVFSRQNSASQRNWLYKRTSTCVKTFLSLLTILSNFNFMIIGEGYIIGESCTICKKSKMVSININN
jgi:hypothetical protein